MKISVLIEERANEELYGEHGLSLLIENDNMRILFDTGQTGLFFDNARKMKLDLEKIDLVILSHGHYDHTGGLKRFITETNYNKKVIVGNGFLNEKYKKENNEFKYIGNSFNYDYYPFTVINDEYKINSNMVLYGNIRCERKSIFFIKKDNYEVDEFKDEIFLTIDTPKGLILICGCSHAGIINIMKQIKQKTGKEIYTFIGGAHTMNASAEEIEKTKAYLQNIKQVYACHCSGDLGFKEVKSGDILINDTNKKYITLLKEQKKKPDYKKEMYQAWTDKNYKDGDKN